MVMHARAHTKPTPRIGIAGFPQSLTIRTRCRRFGIAKWPHRQLRGIDKKIAALKAELNYAADDREVYCRSLQALEDEKLRLSRIGSSSPTPVLSSENESTARRSVSPSKESHAPSPQSAPGDEDDKAEEETYSSSGMPALDLLAAVAGVKEERDREEEARQRLEAAETTRRAPTFLSIPKTGASLPALSSRSCRSKDRAAYFSLDTPPLEPVSPLFLVQERAAVKMCVSPMLKSFSGPLTPVVASTPLVGLSWSG
jgi:hypothetical protein